MHACRSTLEDPTWGSAAGLALLSYALALAQPPVQPSYDRDAWGYIRMGDFDAATAVATAMLARDGKDPLAHEALGFVATLRKQDEAAIGHYAIAVEQRPRLHGAWFNLARLQAGRGDAAAAEAALAKALAISPLPEYRLWLASHLQAQGRVAEAQAQWQAVLSGDASPAERDQATQGLAASRR